jgi:hypothetical protein
LAAAALAASRLLNRPPRLPLGPGVALPADEGHGVAKVASWELLPIAVADPGGGPYWGLRFVGTAGGLGCLQAGLRVGAGLGVTGRDGAFGDDGRVHTLPIASVGGPFPCAALDADGHAFAGVSIRDAPASGLLTSTRAEPGCSPGSGVTVASRTPGSRPVAGHVAPASRAARAAACPAGDQRLIYFGMAGPEARSVTYVTSGKARTEPTVGPEGAYLIVLRAASAGPERYTLLPGAGGGPIRRIDYRNGSVCLVHSTTTRAETCPHIGQVAAEKARVSTGEVRSPVRASVTGGPHGRTLRVRFTARLAAIGSRAQYSIAIDLPGSNPNCGTTVFGPVRGDVAKGQVEQVEEAVGGCRGTFRGTVAYRYGTSPDGRPSDIVGPTLTVGSFSVKVP